MEDAIEVMASRGRRMELEAESWVFVIDFAGHRLDHKTHKTCGYLACLRRKDRNTTTSNKFNTII